LLNKRHADTTVSTSKDSVKDQSILTIAAPQQDYEILSYEKPDGFAIPISTWDSEPVALEEAKNFERDLKVKTIVEKIMVDGKSKYAVHIGVFSDKEKAFIILRTIDAPEQKYQILTHEKPNGYVIQISIWDTEERARDEAKKFDPDLTVRAIVEKVITDGKSKYPLLLGVFSNEKKAYVIFHKIRK
jgi:hypothetical protein